MRKKCVGKWLMRLAFIGSNPSSSERICTIHEKYCLDKGQSLRETLCLSFGSSRDYKRPSLGVRNTKVRVRQRESSVKMRGRLKGKLVEVSSCTSFLCF
jgi:hypothetical protein